MEEQIIKYSTAKIANENGYDIPANLEYVSTLKNRGVLYFNSHRNKGRVHAPTQSMLQKWLRENHQLFVTVSFDPIIHYYNCRIDRWNDTPISVTNQTLGIPEFGSYESALGEGLIHALKQIKL